MDLSDFAYGFAILLQIVKISGSFGCPIFAFVDFSQCLKRAREAKKVFLEVLKPFSSEKGFKPPEALEREARPLAAKPRKRDSKR